MNNRVGEARFICCLLLVCARRQNETFVGRTLGERNENTFREGMVDRVTKREKTSYPKTISSNSRVYTRCFYAARCFHVTKMLLCVLCQCVYVNLEYVLRLTSHMKS